MNTHVIVTGDLVNSRTKDSKIWLKVLEDALLKYSKKFDIFRGDSFQAEFAVENCLEAIFYIKARIKTIAGLDVRMGLGIGAVDYVDEHIKNSTGEALIYSGEVFDSLNKELFAVKSFSSGWNRLTNITLALAIELANKWTVNMAETVAKSIELPNSNQHELANELNRKHQSQVSTELRKAHWYKIKKAIDYCQIELMKRC